MLEAPQDVDFPAGKEELVQAAENAGAPEEVVKALRAIPPDEYGNRDEVARSVRVDPASDLDLSAAQRAEQARRGGRPGQSQHLRDVREAEEAVAGRLRADLAAEPARDHRQTLEDPIREVDDHIHEPIAAWSG